MKKRLVLLLVLLSLVGCTNRFTQDFPDRAIVYQANDKESNGLGFVHADGSEAIEIQTRFRPSQPKWSKDGQSILIREVVGYPGMIFPMPGNLGIVRGRSPIQWCTDPENRINWVVFPISGSHTVISGGWDEIVILDLETCQVVQSLVNYRDKTLLPKTYIHGFSVSDTGDLLVYSEYYFSQRERKYTIKRLSIDTGETQDIGQGINPMLSPDLKKIAYIWFDGLYVMDSDGANNRQLVAYDASADDTRTTFEENAPVPSWSPDGEWVVYHKCRIKETASCNYKSDFSIYTVNLENLTETKILDGGMYPDWRDNS